MRQTNGVDASFSPRDESNSLHRLDYTEEQASPGSDQNQRRTTRALTRVRAVHTPKAFVLCLPQKRKPHDGEQPGMLPSTRERPSSSARTGCARGAHRATQQPYKGSDGVRRCFVPTTPRTSTSSPRWLYRWASSAHSGVPGRWPPSSGERRPYPPLPAPPPWVMGDSGNGDDHHHRHEKR